MGTRSIVLVKQTIGEKIHVKRLYKHWDGYPTDNLVMIHNAIKDCNSSIDQFVSQCEAYYQTDMVEKEFKTAKNKPFNPKFLGMQWDLEWIYTVDLDKKQIKVFGGGYTGTAPQVAYKKGPINPLSYINALYEEYQEEEKKAILTAIYNIRALGYTINKGVKNA